MRKKARRELPEGFIGRNRCGPEGSGPARWTARFGVTGGRWARLGRTGGPTTFGRGPPSGSS
ncbi:hypothetical protein GCM10022223_40620 [Kineosporia mesophila]|uniref:Uncharacterized protein n=1 Tax=Kineosporia mesophila TaxID=566012 RepID=A0ABP6ZV58_9ACTN